MALLVQPSADMSIKIREELREPEPEAIERDIAQIRTWLESQPHLPKDMGMFERWSCLNDGHDHG